MNHNHTQHAAPELFGAFSYPEENVSKQELDDALARLNSHTEPPPAVMKDALTAYAVRVTELQDLVVHKDARISAEVSFQYSIREQERAIRDERNKQHQEEKRELVKQIGHAAAVYRRVIEAKDAGKKTIRLDVLELP